MYIFYKHLKVRKRRTKTAVSKGTASFRYEIGG